MEARVTVAVRVRSVDHNGSEQTCLYAGEGGGASVCVSLSQHGNDGASDAAARVFEYDHTFWGEGTAVAASNQAAVYAAVGVDVAEAARRGLNCCVFAYGQTGSGKTYTMIGGAGDQRGLIPRICEGLLGNAAQTLPLVSPPSSTPSSPPSSPPQRPSSPDGRLRGGIGGTSSTASPAITFLPQRSGNAGAGRRTKVVAAASASAEGPASAAMAATASAAAATAAGAVTALESTSAMEAAAAIAAAGAHSPVPQPQSPLPPSPPPSPPSPPQVPPAADDGQQCTFRASLYEIYCERVRDLLSDAGQSPDLSSSGPSSLPGPVLKVREHPVRGPFVEGVRTVEVRCATDVAALLASGQQRRVVATTKANQASSRSHAVFTLEMIRSGGGGSGDSGGYGGYSKLSLVDLAGSESASSSGESGVRIKEGGAINRSLLALGRVISALAEHSRTDGGGNGGSGGSSSRKNSTASVHMEAAAAARGGSNSSGMAIGGGSGGGEWDRRTRSPPPRRNNRSPPPSPPPLPSPYGLATSVTPTAGSGGGGAASSSSPSPAWRKSPAIRPSRIPRPASPSALGDDGDNASVVSAMGTGTEPIGTPTGTRGGGDRSSAWGWLSESDSTASLESLQEEPAVCRCIASSGDRGICNGCGEEPRLRCPSDGSRRRRTLSRSSSPPPASLLEPLASSLPVSVLPLVATLSLSLAAAPAHHRRSSGASTAAAGARFGVNYRSVVADADGLSPPPRGLTPSPSAGSLSAQHQSSSGGGSGGGSELRARVPYRDSVLTHLLRDCLGGNAVTTMVATVHAGARHADETLSTLRYADRARGIINAVIFVSEDPAAAQLRGLRNQIAELRLQLRGVQEALAAVPPSLPPPPPPEDEEEAPLLMPAPTARLRQATAPASAALCETACGSEEPLAQCDVAAGSDGSGVMRDAASDPKAPAASCDAASGHDKAVPLLCEFGVQTTAEETGFAELPLLPPLSPPAAPLVVRETEEKETQVDFGMLDDGGGGGVGGARPGGSRGDSDSEVGGRSAVASCRERTPLLAGGGGSSGDNGGGNNSRRYSVLAAAAAAAAMAAAAVGATGGAVGEGGGGGGGGGAARRSDTCSFCGVM